MIAPFLVHRTCPVCSSSDISKIGVARDYTVSGERFEIWKCGACTGRFTQGIPTEATIGKYYQSMDYISHSNTRTGLVNGVYHRVRRFAIAQKRKWITQATGLQKGRLLDIGCGTGEFLAGMAAAGWQVQGLEPDPGARAQAMEKGLSVGEAAGLFSLKKEDFHAITLWHVLEHVHDLHTYLEQIYALLAPGGVLFIAVPNPESTDAHFYGFDWAAWDVPRHLYHFSPESMKRLLTAHGFEIRRMNPMPFDSFYVSMLSEKYKKGKTAYLSAFRAGLNSWQRARFQPGLASSILYIAQRRN